MSKYNQIIKCFLELNPNPSDKQFHAFSDALGVDVEELEAAMFKMAGDCISRNRTVRLEQAIRAAMHKDKHQELNEILHLLKDEHQFEFNKVDDTLFSEGTTKPTQIMNIVDTLEDHFNTKFRIDNNDVIKQRSFAIVAPNGLTISRTGGHLRIYYTTSKNHLKAAAARLVAYKDMSVAERTLAGEMPEDAIPYYYAALNDGSTDSEPNETLQDATHSDGGFTLTDQDVLNNDGYVQPRY